jgi:hypothetical protein
MHWLSVHIVHLMPVEPGKQRTDVDSPSVDMWQLMGVCMHGSWVHTIYMKFLSKGLAFFFS